MISFVGPATEPGRLLQPVAGSSNGTGSPNGAWCSADLYVLLVRLAALVRVFRSPLLSPRAPDPLLRLSIMQGGADVERLAASVLEQGERAAPELVLLGMARSRVDDGIDADPNAQDPSALRSRVYNTLLSTAFGSLLAGQTRT